SAVGGSSLCRMTRAASCTRSSPSRQPASSAAISGCFARNASRGGVCPASSASRYSCIAAATRGSSIAAAHASAFVPAPRVGSVLSLLFTANLRRFSFQVQNQLYYAQPGADLLPNRQKHLRSWFCGDHVRSRLSDCAGQKWGNRTLCVTLPAGCSHYL